MPEPLVNSLGYPQRNLIRPNRMPLSVLSHTVCPACSKKILKLLHFEDFHPATNDTISLQRGRFEPRTAPDLCFQPIFFSACLWIGFFSRVRWPEFFNPFFYRKFPLGQKTRLLYIFVSCIAADHRLRSFYFSGN